LRLGVVDLLFDLRLCGLWLAHNGREYRCQSATPGAGHRLVLGAVGFQLRRLFGIATDPHVRRLRRLLSRAVLLIKNLRRS
jgi:hypothetical protein